MIKEAIAILNKREDLDDSMVEQVMGEIKPVRQQTHRRRRS